MRLGVGQLEGHRTLGVREADHHLPAPLHAGHSHHLRRRDVVVPGAEVVDELVVALPGVHRPILRPDLEQPAVLEGAEERRPPGQGLRLVQHLDPDLVPVDEDAAAPGGTTTASAAGRPPSAGGSSESKPGVTPRR